MEQTTVNKPKVNKVPLSAALGYGTAALAYNFVYTLVTNYVNIFFTNVLGISLAAAGVIMLLARLWDGVNDPIMGTIVDKTNTKDGKYRPYMKWGMLPLSVMTILIFLAPDLSIQLKTIYAGVTYILWGMAYTFANIPYMSMQSTLSFDSNERTKIITIKTIFVLVGALIAMIAVPALAFTKDGIQADGFVKAAIIGAVLVIVCMYITFKATVRFKYVDDKNVEKTTIKDRVDAVVKNPPLIILAIVLFLVSVLTAIIGAQNYFVVNVLGQPELVMAFTLAGFAPMILAMALMPLAMKLEKRVLMGGGMVIYVLGSIGFYLVPNSNINGLLLMSAVRGLGIGFAMILIWSMIADSVDFAALKTGKQQGGIVFSTSTFMQKAAGGIGAALMNFLLIAVGFNKDLATQTAEAADGVKMILSFGPAILAAAVVVLMFFYPLSKAKMKEIQSELGRD